MTFLLGFAIPWVLACAQADARSTAELRRWPEGAVARAIAELPADVEPASPPEGLGRPGEVPGIPRAALRDPAVWRAWMEALARERETSAPERRARLALFALAQERWEDAWTALDACASSPAWCAALLPRFMPGVPAGTRAARGGFPAPLIDGVVLAPAVPPGFRVRDRAPRSMSLERLRIGEAVLRLRVTIESEGVEIEIAHVEGGAARFAVRIPHPEEYTFSDRYADWYRVESEGDEIAVTVEPGDEAHTLYGRFEPREASFTRRLPERLPAQLAEGGLWLVIGAGDPERPFVQALAEILSSGALGMRAIVVDPIAEGDDRGLSGVTVDLATPSTRAEKLAGLASAIERFLLPDPRAAPR